MKRFGFHPDQIYFNMRNPQKVRYLNTKNLGNFEAPAKTQEKNLHKLADNYQKRLDFEVTVYVDSNLRQRNLKVKVKKEKKILDTIY